MTQDFHLKPGYVERAEPHYFEDEEDSEWQPDVYPFALGLLGACGASKVIDIGCEVQYGTADHGMHASVRMWKLCDLGDGKVRRRQAGRKTGGQLANDIHS